MTGSRAPGRRAQVRDGHPPKGGRRVRGEKAQMFSHMPHGGDARAAGGDAGFTLIEILISTVIMLIVSMGVITALSFTGWATTFTGQRTKALNLANQYIERARDLPYDNIGTYVDGPIYGDPPGVIHTPDVVGDFTVATAVSWQRDATTGRALYKNVAVTVTWTRPIPGTIRLTTSIYGQSNLVNTGDLQITFVDHDTNAPIPGLPVSITPAASTQIRTVSTDTSGTAFYGFVPTGLATMAITTSSWVFDPVDVPAINVNAGDVLSVYTVKAQKPSKVTIHVQGTAGQALSGAAVQIAGGLGTYNGTTNSSGDVTFGNLILANYAVSASLTGRKTQTGTVAVVAPCGGTALKTIVLNDPYLITYTVKGTAGTGLAGAAVTLSTPDGAMNGTTASDGTVTFSLISTGTIGATAVLSPRRTQTRSDAIGGVPWGQTFAFSITLNDPSTIVYTIIGTHGDALVGALVQVTGPLGDTWTDTSDSSGNAHFIVPDTGNYTVQASLAPRQPRSVVCNVPSYGSAITGSLTLDDPVPVVIHVQGTLGNALAGATVTLTGPGGTGTATTNSSGDANFTVVTLGTYTATAHLAGRQDNSVVFAITVYGLTYNRTVTLNDPAQLTVTVTNDLGAAISGVAVTLSGPSGGSGTTNSSGQITFTSLIAGAYSVTATKNSYDPHVTQPIAISLAPGDAKTLPIQLDRYGSIQVTATSKTGSTLGSIWVRVKCLDDGTIYDLQTGSSGSSKGKTAVTPVPPGNYSVNFSPIPPNASGFSYTANNVLVTVAPNQAQTVSLQAK
jgi:prepilin-type N-terminal cleavage/methylation domain-containing protein